MADKNRDIFRSRAFVVGTVQSVVWVVLGAGIVRMVDGIEKIFQDFDAQLPIATMLLLSVSHLLARYWYAAFLPLIAWPFANFGVVALLSRRKGLSVLTVLWYTATWILFVLVFAYAAIALLLPLIVTVGPLSPPATVPATPSMRGQ
jgi:type II secretory pathway component PulF